MCGGGEMMVVLKSSAVDMWYDNEKKPIKVLFLLVIHGHDPCVANPLLWVDKVEV